MEASANNCVTPFRINYRFASKAEGQQRLLANTDYYNRLTQTDIDWRMRKTGATLDELMALGRDCVRDFTDEEKVAVTEAISFVEVRLRKMGAILPLPKEGIVFIKTTMMDEGNAFAYTHKTEVYLGVKALASSNNSIETNLKVVIAHELFHCLTRNSLGFRDRMYGLLGFTIKGCDFDFSPTIREMIMANPDVEHYDSYAEFSIKEVTRFCIPLTLYTHTWPKALPKDNEAFFDYCQNVLVPIDELDTYYQAVDDPIEECLALHFSYALVYGLDELPNELVVDKPMLLDKIIALMKQF